MSSLLDTSTLSAIMRRDPVVLPRAQRYLAGNRRFTISILTRYEILRGLKARGAVGKVANFDAFCARSLVLPLRDVIVVKAADIYADLVKRGQLIGDADILIAATALVHELAVVSSNEKHFRRVPGLVVENWLPP